MLLFSVVSTFFPVLQVIVDLMVNIFGFVWLVVVVEDREYVVYKSLSVIAKNYQIV